MQKWAKYQIGTSVEVREPGHLPYLGRVDDITEGADVIWVIGNTLGERRAFHQEEHIIVVAAEERDSVTAAFSQGMPSASDPGTSA